MHSPYTSTTMTRVAKSPGRLIRALAIGAATIMIAACSTGPAEQGVDPAGAPTETVEHRFDEDAVGLREDVAITVAATESGPEQWLLDATVKRKLSQFQIVGLKVAWNLPGDAEVSGFSGECTPISDRQTCISSSVLFASPDVQVNFDLLIDLPRFSTDSTIVVSVTYEFDQYDTYDDNNTAAIVL